MEDFYDSYAQEENNDLEEIIEQGIECEEDFENQENEEEDENGQGKVVKPKEKKIVKNPRPKLNEEKLKGPRGLLVLEEFFKNIKFLGKGHEENDLDQILKRLEHWQYRLYPSLMFDDFLEKVEKLGHKQAVKTYIKKIRMDLITQDNNPISNEFVNEEVDLLFHSTETQLPKFDPFDELLNHDIYSENIEMNTSSNLIQQEKKNTESMHLTQEQIDQIEKNRLIALQKREKRLKAQNTQDDSFLL